MTAKQINLPNGSLQVRVFESKKLTQHHQDYHTSLAAAHCAT